MKLFNLSLATLVVVLIVASVTLYKGDLSTEYVDKKYSNAASAFLTMENGAKVHYRDQGTRDNPVIVLVHGSNASLHTWEPWVDRLSPYYRVVTLDLPAHGLTGATPDHDYSSQAQINTVHAIVTHLGIDAFVLGGNSMGGGVTWRYTLEHPQNVKAMLLISSSGLPQFKRQSTEKKASSQNLEQTQEIETPLVFTLMSKPWFRYLARYIDPYFLAVQGAKSSYNNSPVVTDTLIDRYYELSLRDGTREAIISRFSGFGSRSLAPVDTTALDLPTLIMWGKEDAVIPVSVADQFADALENTTLVIYENVGHVPMEEIPTRSAEDIISFLEGLNL
jgi:pimeloyl-ACP methyl ester carboxylesterase